MGKGTEREVYVEERRDKGRVNGGWARGFDGGRGLAENGRDSGKRIFKETIGAERVCDFGLDAGWRKQIRCTVNDIE